MTSNAAYRVVDGVILSGSGPVHRDLGGRTACGERVLAGRAAAASIAQILVYRLPVCPKCYHDPRARAVA